MAIEHTNSTSDEFESESESEPEPEPLSHKTSKLTDSTSNEEESESESESESEPDKTSKLVPTSNPKMVAIEPTNLDEEESESESESEPDKTSKLVPISSSNPKMVAIEPTNLTSDEEKESESESEFEPDKTSKLVPTESEPAVPDRVINQSKAPAELDDGHAKGVKKETVIAMAAPAAQTTKKQLFQRLFSEENEIELIQGMIAYAEQKCKDPLADVTQFYEFVKESLHVDVNFKQVLNKSRKLKLKFEKNLAKVKENGKVRSFVNPHEKKMFELSETLWGGDNHKNVVMGRSSKKVNVTNKKRKTVSFGNESEVGKTRLVEFQLPTEDEIMSVGLERLSEADKAELDKKWKDIKVQQLKLYVKRLALMKEQAELVLNAM